MHGHLPHSDRLCAHCENGRWAVIGRSVLRSGQTHREICLSQHTTPSLRRSGQVQTFLCKAGHMSPWRCEGDMCEPASSNKTAYIFVKTPVARSLACSTPAFSRQLSLEMNSLVFKRAKLIGNAAGCSKAPHNPQKATRVCLRLPFAASRSEAHERKVDCGWLYTLIVLQQYVGNHDNVSAFLQNIILRKNFIF